MSEPARSMNLERVALVEGQDELHLAQALLGHLGITNVQVLDVAGKENFRLKLGPLLADARTRGLGLKALGILRDADDNPVNAFGSVQEVLRHEGSAVPLRHGEVLAGSPAVGIFIAPDGQSPGAIENLCWQSIESSAIATCVEMYLNCAKRENALESNNEGKTRVHAYLATRADPTSTVGRGAVHEYWTLDHEAFKPLGMFLTNIANI